MEKNRHHGKGNITLVKNYDPKTMKLTRRKTPEIDCSYEYDREGHRVGLVRSDGYKEVITYDAENYKCTIRNNRGFDRTFPYDPVRNMVFYKP